MKKIKLQNNSGMALVITMGILLLVTLLALGFFSSQYTERNASTNYRYSIVAEQIADAGYNHALLLLLEDRDTTISNAEYKLFDAPFELWGPKYTGGDGKRLAYKNGDKGVSIDAIIKGSDHSSDEDARWIDFKDENNVPIGRYAVLVMPENGKININSAGDNQFTGSPTVVQGYSTFDISLVELFKDPQVNISWVNAQLIVGWRIGGGAGRVNNDDDGNADFFGRDKIDNDGDAAIDENNEGVDDPYEYFYDIVSKTHVLTGNDLRYPGVNMATLTWNGDPDNNKNLFKEKNLGTLLTTDSYENDLLDFYGKERIRLNKYAFPYQKDGNDADAANKKTHAEKIRDVFIGAGFSPADAAQLAVNIVDYADYDINTASDIRADVRTQLDSATPGKPFLGVEKTVYIYEVNAASYNDSDPFLDRDADNDFIELINISDKDINLQGWKIEVGGRTFTFGNTTINAFNGWGNSQNIIVLAVEKGPDPIQYDYRTGAPIPPVSNPNGYYTGNGHSFMDDIGGDASRVIEASVLGPGLTGANNRITLYDNKNNLVDVVDSTDSVDPMEGGATTWQKDDPTTERDAREKDHTALDYNSNSNPTKTTAWLDANELKHVKDRYFASVAEIAMVSNPTLNWDAFVPKGTQPGTGNYFDLLLAVFDKFTIARRLELADILHEFEGTNLSVPAQGFNMGAPITQITTEGAGGNITNEASLVFGRININSIIDNGQAPVYSAIRLLPPHNSMNFMYNTISTVLKSGVGFGEPNPAGYFAGLGGTGVSRMEIEYFLSISNLLTTKSNVFKIIVIAQAYDRKFSIASERKLEVIVDRGYNIDASATSYSDKARNKAKQVKVLSYRWITEE